MDNYVDMFDEVGGLRSGNRLYFKRYPFKVRLKLSPVGNCGTIPSVIATLQSKNIDFVINKHQGSVSVFFTNADDALVFAVGYQGVLMSVTGPENKDQLERLSSEPNVSSIFRAPFWNRYRYKISMMSDDRDDIEDAVHSLLPSLVEHQYESGPTRVLYVNDIESVMLVELVAGQYIKDIFEAISKDTVDETHPSTCS